MTPDAAARGLLRALFDAGVARVHAGNAVREAFDRRGRELSVAGRRLASDARLVVLAVGKAALAMAAAVEMVAAERIAGGLVVTKQGHGGPLRILPVREAGHPLPDARSAAAADEAMQLVARARAEDVLIVLLSGGASALLTRPLPGLSLDDLARTTRLLLEGGADIAEVNAVRKHLTAVSGGRLARRATSREVIVLAISDVAGDDPAVIGSGPCAPDPTRFADVLALLERRGLREKLPAAVLRFLEAGEAGLREESGKPGEPGLARVHTRILARNRDALEAARAESNRRGIFACSVTDELRGEARVAGRRLAALAMALATTRPVVLFAGGEPTVRVAGDGVGGRCQELALAAALGLEGNGGVTLLAAGTDGSDGPTSAAGAFADGGTVARGRARRSHAPIALDRNDSHGFFAAEGGLLVTGPTATNVRDLVLIHVTPHAAQRAGAARSGGG